MTLKQIRNLSPKQLVALHGKFVQAELTIKEYLSLPPVFVNRDTVYRWNNKPGLRKALETFRAEHLRVALNVNVLDIKTQNGDVYPAGNVSIIDGNTRRMVWADGLSDYIPEVVYATVYFYATLEETIAGYNTFDSQVAAESNHEKIQGILKNTFKFDATSEKIRKGQISTALGMVAHYLEPNLYPKNPASDKQIYLISDWIEEIKGLDPFCKTTRNWHQPMIAASLLMLRKYGLKNSKLNSILERLDRLERVEKVKKPKHFNGVTHIGFEFNGNIVKWPAKSTSWDKVGGMRQTTNFVLYWLEQEMEDKELSGMGNNWETTAERMFSNNSNVKTLFPKVVNG